MNIKILEKGNKQHIRLFRNLPFKLYKGNRNWVPPPPGEIDRVMTPSKHPFYQQSEADFFIVEHQGETIGRIAVLHNQSYCDFHNVKTAFFYYFESTVDQQVSNLLFDACKYWAKKRGLNSILGPKGFLRSNGAGLLINGFTEDTAMGIPYNHAYYQKLLESYGFSKETDFYSGFLDKHPDPIIHEIAAKVLKRGNFWIKGFRTVDEILEWVPKIEDVQHFSFASNPNYFPSTDPEFNFISRKILSIANPNFIKIIMHEKEIAGFIIAYPNLTMGLKRSKGNLFPFGWLMLALDRRFSRVVDINGLGILAQYQGLGGNAVLYSELDKIFKSARIKRAEVVQVDERNFRSKADMESMGVVNNKVHRLYKLDIHE